MKLKDTAKKTKETVRDVSSKIRNEDGFKKTINLDPKAIPEMNRDQKQDCMAEIDKYRKQAWMFSVVFGLGIFAFILIYSMISLVYTLRFEKLLPSISTVMYFVPFIAVIPAVFAHMMNEWCVMLAIAGYLTSALLTIFTGELINMWVSLLAIAGAVLYFRLFKVTGTYAALSKEDGFPDFFVIESGVSDAKAIIERNKEKEEPLHPFTVMAIASAEKERAEEKKEEDASE
ncbi:MAG: hypothetical protein IJF18_06660 [Oscillospiraceae bacterium]|nr:hypothetical protein [Oscillospiraceae bacterium]